MELTLKQNNSVTYNVTETLDDYSVKGDLKVTSGIVTKFSGTVVLNEEIVANFDYSENGGRANLMIFGITPENLTTLMPKIQDLIVAIKSKLTPTEETTNE